MCFTFCFDWKLVPFVCPYFGFSKSNHSPRLLIVFATELYAPVAQSERRSVTGFVRTSLHPSED